MTEASGERSSTTIPPAVWLLVSLHALLLTVYSVLAPTYRAPDEPHHVDLAVAVSRGQAWPWPAPTGRTNSLQVIASLVAANYADPEKLREVERVAFHAEDAIPRGQRPRFGELARDRPSDVRNQMPQHPPLYYGLAGGLLSVTGALALPFDQVVGGLRLLSVVLVSVLPLLAYATARRVRASEPVALAAAVALVAIPQLTHVGSVVNNDALLLLLFGVFTFLMARVITGDAGLSTATGIGLIAGLALLTKGFALVSPICMVAAYTRAMFLPGRTASRAGVLGRGVVALAVAGMTGGWWWVRNVLVYGALQPSGMTPTIAPASFTPDPGAFARIVLTYLPQRFFGSFGWLQVAIPWPVVWLATAALAAGLVVGLAAPPRPGPRRVDLALLLMPIAGVLAVVVLGSWTYYVTSSSVSGNQGRYLFTGLVGLLVVAATGYGRLAGRAVRWLPLALMVAGIALQAVGITTMLQGFWAKPLSAGLREGIAALLAWSPWPPAVFVGCAAAALALAVVLLAVLTPRPGRNAREETYEEAAVSKVL